jgi:AcrR family transcriptional regulator
VPKQLTLWTQVYDGDVETASSVAAPRAPILTGRRLPSDRVAQMQREKILAAAVDALDELGWENATVAEIVSRARVSRSCFYALFDDRDGCIVAILDAAAIEVRAELDAAGAWRLPWSERVEAGLVAILGLADRRRDLARVCVVAGLRGGPSVRAHWTGILGGLSAALDDGRSARAGGRHRTPLTADGLVGGAFAVVHSRLLRADPRPFLPLAPELLQMLLLPYVGEGAPARRPRDPEAAGGASARPLERPVPAAA